MKIFAHHAHVFPDNVHSFNIVECTSPGSISNLLSLMQKCSIAKVVAFAPLPELCQEIEMNSNRWLAKEISKHSELTGFGVIDFKKNNVEEQVEEIKDLGLKGIKLHPAVQHFSITSSKAFEVYKAAEKLKLPISFHTGIHWHRLRENHPLLFDEVAHYFPELRFSMEHIGGYHFFKDAVAVIMNNFKGGEMRLGSNIYAGIVSNLQWTRRANFWYIGKEKIEELIELIGSDFIIFGLDFPFRIINEIKESIHIIENLNVSRETKEKILGKNLEQFLNLDSH